MKNLLSLILLFFAVSIFSQKEANFWYFGNNAGLDFTTSPPNTIRGSLSTDEGSASISNSNGELQFYTDGQTVYNNTGSIMNNGSGLLGNSSSSQSAIIVPKPLDNAIYYIFTVTDGNSGDGVNYSVVNINKNNGLGEVISKNISLPEAISAKEKITAVKGLLCNTFWVVTSDANNFYAYLIDSNGVSETPVTSNHSFVPNLRGYLKFSPDGKTLVSASQDSGSTFLYDFDANTGLISVEKNLHINGLEAYGVGFSRSSEKLYISTGVHSQPNGSGSRNTPGDARIFQFDLSSNDIAVINTSSTEVYQTFKGYRGALQLAADGKIYYARSRQNSLGVINFPEKDAANINFIEDGLSLKGQTSTEGLPPFIQSFFLDVELKDEGTNEVVNFEYLQICAGEDKNIIPETVVGTNVKYTWTFDNGTTKTEISTSTLEYKLELTNLQAKNSGVYSLVIKLEDSCSNTIEYNATFNLKVNPLPLVNTIPTYNQCDFDNASTDGITSFNLESKEAELAKYASDVTVTFFEPEDTSYSSPITNKIGYRNPSTKPFNHNLLVKITNNITDCYNIGELDLEITATSLATYTNMYKSEIDSNSTSLNPVMSNGSGDAIFDFDQKIDNIILNSGGVFNRNDFRFSFFRTSDDAKKEINKIEKPYKESKFTDSTVIYIRISKGNTCVGVGKFNLYVNKRPIPKGNPSPIILCVSNPIDSPQPFTVNLNADTGVDSDTYAWYLNETLLTSETNANLETNKEGEYRVEAYRSFLNSPAHSDNSFTTGYNTFTVLISNVALLSPESITFKDDQDNTADNTITIKVMGKGDYEYALNNNKLASFVKGAENLSYTFTNVPTGLNKVYIRDRNECGIINTAEISFIYFQRHFTPNGDGYFDTWKILGVDNGFYKEIKLQVFDRFGKILKNIDLKTNAGWNGTYNGKPLPSNDYWYNAVLIDISGNIRKKTGHFSLLRK